MGAPNGHKTIRIGVFMPSGAQVLDMACVDIFGTISYEYVKEQASFIPAPIITLAPSVEIIYIGTAQPGELIQMTSNMKIECHHHMSDPEVQPGKLDIVVVPGPDPNLTFDAPVREWLAAHGAEKETDILCVCTGIYLCGEAGLLRGKRVCGPRALQSQLKAKFEGATWMGDEFRWIQDGNFWSCGGITNGNDLVAAYVRHSPRFPSPVAEFGLVMTDTGDRSQRYETSQTAVTLGVVWQVLKAVFLGLGKKKGE
ncbi:class I glutamine amidotransferase-like protein [Lasiosphaeris hirsuta]|uniref:Class I glutamine amidotransferase-like protein n=1 Tax=Lasiosphaeris hirsuta TaxID=260670 RepID=A0AA40E8W4_9PEZI|nr:class I glutamine amidotransferase-like protein [Lasiosphaeris hirsuta]